MKVGSLEIELLANMARLQKDMDQAKRTVDGAMRSIERSAENAKAAIVGIASGLSVGAFATMVKASIDAVDSLNDLSKSTGIAVENLAGLDWAAKLSGTDLNGLAKGINKLAVEMGKDAEKFAKIGVTAKDPIEAFKQLSDVFVSIEDPQQRAAFGAAALGKQWEVLAPLMAEGGENIGAMVEKGQRLSGVTQEMADEAGKFNDAVDELYASLGGVATRIGGDLLPLLNAIASEMVNAGDKAGGLKTSFNPLTETLRALAIVGGNVAFVFKAVGTEIGGIAAQLGALARLDFKAASAIGDMMKADAAAARAEFDAWEQKILNAGNGGASPPSGSPPPTAGGTPSGVAGFIAGGGKTGATAASKAEKEAYEAALKYAQERAKLRNDEYEAINDYLQGEEAARVAAVKAANDAVQAAQDEYDQYGLTRSQIEEITLARMRDKLAGIDSSSAVAQSLEQEIAAQEKLIGILRKGEERDAFVKEQERATAEAQKIWENFTENVQRNLGDGLYDAMNGNFKNIGDSFKQMLQRMLADALAANIMRALIGNAGGGGFGSFLSGIFGGAFADGGEPPVGKVSLVGERGPELFVPKSAGTIIPNEQLGGKTVTVTYAPTIQIDSRADQAEVRALVNRAVQNGNARLVEQLQRAGAI